MLFHCFSSTFFFNFNTDNIFCFQVWKLCILLNFVEYGKWFAMILHSSVVFVTCFSLKLFLFAFLFLLFFLPLLSLSSFFFFSVFWCFFLLFAWSIPALCLDHDGVSNILCCCRLTCSIVQAFV